MPLLADVRPLRASPEFRRAWIGHAFSAIGTGMTGVALAVQVYDLTGSSFAVGAIGLATLVPTLALGLFGGSIADAVDRRRLVLVTSSALALVATLLAVQAALDLRQLWLLYALAAAQSGLSAVDAPARRTFPPRLLPAGLVPAAAALTHLAWQISFLAGPLLAGVLMASIGAVAVYLLDAATYAFAVWTIAGIRPMPPAGGGTAAGVRSVAEGLRYARRHPLVAGSLLADLDAMVLALPHALFPALADTRFGGGELATSLLYAALGLGGLLAAALSGPLGAVRRPGVAMLVAVGCWGLAILGLGLSPTLWLALGFLVVAGAADVVTVVCRATILQLTTPDELRGRISGVDFVVGAGGPQLGNVRAGAVAAFAGPAASAALGGLACGLGALALAVALPALRRYRTDTSR
ncbi:MFS transporter [Cryptosporangium aurantiacum]|uniref:Transmembrane secretion effector n=1 Tax=Cryptosporangium aurantiacum TaxID=134849 RepID=A0A1M7K4V0_9ACTN|nr:MFS transporter [Cryptosporangium aurantiacum]SHM60286.1 Transmembrane secretion effector [Cryptosporangium aurantiacum]